MNKRFLSIILSLLIVVPFLSGCEKSTEFAKVKTKNYANIDMNSYEAEDGVVCENERFVLSWDDTYKQVSFKDKISGAVYSTAPKGVNEVTIDENGDLISYGPNVKSPIIVYYHSAKTLAETTALAYADAISEGDVYTEIIENGIRVTYDFYMQEITVPVEYTILEDRFDISIDPTQISDNGENYVTAVAVAPFLSSLKNDSEDSYLFLPDGSGAIVEPVTIDFIGKQGSARVYGDDLYINTFDLPSYTENVKMPVFGIKNGNNALACIITSAAEQAYINWEVGSENIGHSSVYAFFRIRGYNLVESPKGFSRADIEIKVFDEYISPNILTVSYYSLSGVDANYVGMANTYRNYLIKNGRLEKSENKNAVVSLKVLGGLQQQEFTFGIPHNTLKSLTTVEQAQDIAEYFSENINGNIIMNLIGFGTTGIDSGEVGGGFKIDSKFGSKKQAKALSDYCKQNDISLFMDFDIIGFSESGSGFSLKSDSAKLPNDQTLYLFNYDNVTRKKHSNRYTLLSRKNLPTAAEKAKEAISKYDFEGVSFESLSFTSYSDYSVEGAGVSSGMGELVPEILSDVGKKLRVLGNSANSYAVSKCDYIIDVPTKSSQYDVATFDIPFYEIVFRGYASMSGESVNLASDSNNMILRLIEAGISPTYTLIYDYDNTLITTAYPSLCGSSFEGNKEKIVETVGQISKVLEILDDSAITNHEILNNGLRITTFNNGVKIAINYTDNALNYNGTVITAKDYAVLEG